MQNLLLLVFLLATGGAYRPASPGCRQYHTGTFSVRLRHPQYDFSFLVTRKGNIQTETDQRTGAISKLAVTWLDDCTYQLLLLETTEHFPKEIEEYRRSAPLTTHILGGTDRYYLFRSQRGSQGLARTDTMWVVR